MKKYIIGLFIILFTIKCSTTEEKPTKTTPSNLQNEKFEESSGSKTAEKPIDKSADENEGLLLAAEHGNLEGVQKALENGTNIEEKTDNRKTALILASEKGHLEIVQYLVEKKASLKETESDEGGDGISPLSSASESGHFDIVKYLIEKKADVDGYSVYSPLGLASESGHFDIVKYLIEKKPMLMKHRFIVRQP